MPIRVVFMGTAELACASLRALLQSGLFTVQAVVTQPDRPKGRALKPQPSPVQQVGAEAALPILQPEKARNPAFFHRLAEFNPEVVVVAAYGQILPSRSWICPSLAALMSTLRCSPNTAARRHSVGHFK